LGGLPRFFLAEGAVTVLVVGPAPLVAAAAAAVVALALPSATFLSTEDSGKLIASLDDRLWAFL